MNLHKLLGRQKAQPLLGLGRDEGKKVQAELTIEYTSEEESDDEGNRVKQMLAWESTKLANFKRQLDNKHGGKKKYKLCSLLSTPVRMRVAMKGTG